VVELLVRMITTCWEQIIFNSFDSFNPSGAPNRREGVRKEKLCPDSYFYIAATKITSSTMKSEELRLFHQKWRIWIADGQQKAGCSTPAQR